MRTSYVHFYGLLRSEQLCDKFFEKLYLICFSSAHIYEFPERTSWGSPCISPRLISEPMASVLNSIWDPTDSKNLSKSSFFHENRVLFIGFACQNLLSAADMLPSGAHSVPGVRYYSSFPARRDFGLWILVSKSYRNIVENRENEFLKCLY